jgi:hypothetical protein
MGGGDFSYNIIILNRQLPQTFRESRYISGGEVHVTLGPVSFRMTHSRSLSRGRLLLQNLVAAQLVKIYPVFYGTRK